MEQNNNIQDAAIDIGNEWLSVLFPMIGTSISTFKTAADTLLLSKIGAILHSTPNIKQWLRIAPYFQREHPQYRNTITNLIYSINAIHEEESLDVYSNLLHAWQLQLIGREMFFRLAWCLPHIYSKDLQQLNSFYMVKRFISGNAEQMLYNYGLLEGNSYFAFSEGSSLEAWLSESGLELLRCGLHLDRYDEFHNFDPGQLINHQIRR